MNFIEVNSYDDESRPRILINIEDIIMVIDVNIVTSSNTIRCRLLLKNHMTISLSDKYDDVLRTLKMVNEKEGQENTVNIAKINDLYVDDIESNEALYEE